MIRKVNAKGLFGKSISVSVELHIPLFSRSYGSRIPIRKPMISTVREHQNLSTHMSRPSEPPGSHRHNNLDLVVTVLPPLEFLRTFSEFRDYRLSDLMNGLEC